MKRLIANIDLETIDEDVYNKSSILSEDEQELQCINSKEEKCETPGELFMLNMKIGDLAYVDSKIYDYQFREDLFVDIDGTIYQDNDAQSHFDILYELAVTKHEQDEELYQSYVEDFQTNKAEELNDEEPEDGEEPEHYEPEDIDVYEYWDEFYEYLTYDMEFNYEQYENFTNFSRRENRDMVALRPYPSEIINILNIEKFGFGNLLEDGLLMLDTGTVNLTMEEMAQDCANSSIDFKEIYIIKTLDNDDETSIVKRIQ